MLKIGRREEEQEELWISGGNVLPRQEAAAVRHQFSVFQCDAFGRAAAGSGGGGDRRRAPVPPQSQPGRVVGVGVRRRVPGQGRTRGRRGCRVRRQPGKVRRGRRRQRGAAAAAAAAAAVPDTGG